MINGSLNENSINTMKKLSYFSKSIFVLAMGLFFMQSALAQCGKFTDTPKESEALEAHVLYRDAVKMKDYDGAFENWKIAYELAPAADGKRASHYSDGIIIYKHKAENEADEAKRKEYFDIIMRLYDEQVKCYKNESFVYGRKAFDMFYGIGADGQKITGDVMDTKKTLEQSVSYGGNNTEYVVMVPYATVVAQLFTDEKMDKAAARKVYKELNDICDHNIEKNAKFKAQYEYAKSSMNQVFAGIEYYIFDCDYFKEKFKPQFEANPDDPDFLKESIMTLKRQGCDSTDVFLMQLEEKWSKYAVEENAKIKAEFLKENPAVWAKELYDEDDYDGAIAKYKEAIEAEADTEKQASYLFSIASIQFRKKKSYNTARETAYKAAKLRPGWGRPYMLIGDMYGSSARSCGDSWDQRLAILAAMDKYGYAKSIDSEVAEEASTKLSKYYSSMPAQEEGFMRGVKAGQSVKVGCWIGETVKIRFAN
jgi:hypothetical protein